MSIAAKQVKEISNQIVKEFVKSGVMPSFNTVSRAIKNRLSTIQTGQPLLHPRIQPRRQVFKVETFNDNLDEIIKDLETVNMEQIDQVVFVLRHFNAGEAELRKINNELKKLSADLARLQLLQKNSVGYLYSIGDSFNDSDRIDLERSTVALDSELGAIKLSSGPYNTLKLPLLHLRNIRIGNFKIIKNNVFVTKQISSPNSRFGNIFNDLNEIWKQEIYTSEPRQLRGTFSFSLSENLNPIVINQISIITHTQKPMLVSVQYKNAAVSDWIAIPTVSSSKYIIDKFTWHLSPDQIKKTQKQIENNEKGSISELRFILSKDIPDTTVDNEYLYEFGIRNISINFVTNQQEGILVSKSLEISDVNNQRITINQVSLETTDEILPGTAINYYVAPDRHLDLIFQNPSGHVSSFNNPEATTWASGVTSDQTKALETEVRTWARHNEQDFDFNNTNYRYWDPDWIQLRPLNKTNQTDASGNIGVDVAKFNTIIKIDSDEQNLNTQWISRPKTRVHNIDYYDIFRFAHKPVPSTIRVWAGKSCWLHRIERDSVIKSVRGSGIIQDFVNDENTPEGIFPIDPLVTASGNIIKGSIVNVGPIETLEIAQGFYNGLPPHPDYFTQIKDNKLWIVRNTALATNEISPRKHIAFTYKFRDPIVTNSWETNVFLAKDEEATVALDVGDATNIRVTNYNENDDFELESRPIPLKHKTRIQTLKLKDIGQGYGWYHIGIDIPSQSRYLPTKADIMSSGVQYYAFRYPMTYASEYYLMNSIHQYEHFKCTVVENQDLSIDEPINVLRINDITQPSGSIQYLTKFNDVAQVINSDQLFSDSNAIAKFFDIQYQAITDEVTNLLFKCVLHSDSKDKTPTVYDYTINIGNEIRSK